MLQAAKTSPASTDSNEKLLGAQQETRLLTPMDARKILENGGVEDGDLDRAKWEKYRDLMLEGHWYYNGVGIGIAKPDANGREEVVRGRHRLKALVESGTEQYFLVAWNMNERIAATMRQHQQRTFRSFLEAEKKSDPALLSRTLTQVTRFDRGIFGTEQPINWDDMLVVLDENPEIEEGVALSREYHLSKVPRRVRPLLCAMALKAGHRDTLIRLLELSSANDPAFKDSMHPAAELRATFTRTSVTQFHIVQQLAFSIMALNDMIEGVEEVKTRWKFPTKLLEGKNGKRATKQELLQRAGKTPNFGLPNITGYEGMVGTLALHQNKRGQHIEQNVEGATGDIPDGDKTPFSEIHMFTPEEAARVLSLHNSRNRDINMTNAERISRDIEKGRIATVNTESIAFDVKGELINGQHRLQAVVLAKTPATFTVARNCDILAMDTYDQEKPADIGDSHDLSTSQLRAVNAAANMFWRTELGYRAWGQAYHKKTRRPIVLGRPTSAEVLDLRDAHPALYQAVEEAKRLKELSLGNATYFVAAGLEEDPIRMQRFLSYMESSANIPAGHFFHEMRDLLLSLKWEAAGAQWASCKRVIPDHIVQNVMPEVETPKTKKHFLLAIHRAVWLWFLEKEKVEMGEGDEPEAAAKPKPAAAKTSSGKSTAAKKKRPTKARKAKTAPKKDEQKTMFDNPEGDGDTSST